MTVNPSRLSVESETAQPIHSLDHSSSDHRLNVSPTTIESDVADPNGEDSWQVVDFPGTMSINQLSGPDSQPVTPSHSNSMAYSNAAPDAPMSSEREAELMSLIRDLNECNDVLLEKVGQLEEALDKSQTALQAEIDRTHGPVVSESRTLSDRHIAQMVTELEVSNQALKRHQVLNETLQTELATNRDRVAQLDQECAQVQQKYADQCQRLLQAETSVRDLRVRLQRQQRYTLQFKAALEKCLNVSSGAQVTSSELVSGVEAAMPTVSMPKVETIAPWSDHGPSSRLDPQLEALIRGSQSSSSEPALTDLPAPAVTNAATNEDAASEPDADAEAQLWRDLARVIEIPDEMVAASPTLYDTEDVAAETEREAAVDTGLVAMPAPETGAAETLSPWDAAADPYLPAMDFPEANPAPVVYPLRAQRRISSMAAVDLPMFPRLKQPQPAQPTQD
ncbi:MAG: hypothetical protein AAFQ61_01865 [Cyanobacteria bacterium J06626_23]